MVNLREKIKDDRGLLKKIELAIPGFRGYRKREDLRIADSLLRKQLADKIKNISRDLEECRQALTRNMNLDFLENSGHLVNSINALEGKIRHAEQGYMGISPDYQIRENELNKLYEWDLDLIFFIENLKKHAGTLKTVVNTDDNDKIRSEMDGINSIIRQFIEIFEKRNTIIAGLGVE
jgi:hypothetical protein